MTARANKNKENKTESYDGFIPDITNKKEAQERLKESENHLSAFVNSSSNMIYIKDENEKYLNVNESLCEFLNKDEEAIKYKRDEEIPNNPFLLAPTSTLESSLTNNTIIRETVQINDRIFELSNFQITVGEKLRYGGIYRDITERTKQEKIQHFLYDISELSFTENSLSNYLEKIHQEIKKLISADNFYIALYDSESQEYSFPYSVDSYATCPENYTSKLRGSLTDFVRRNRIGKIIVGKEQEQVYADSNAPLIDTPSAAWMGAPIINKLTNQSIGMIAVQDYTNQKAYSENDLKILEIIAHNIGVFIKRVKYIELLKNAKEHAEESKMVYEALFKENVSAMILVDDRNAKIEDANQSACDFYGYTKQEMLTLFINDLSTDSPSVITSEINKTIKTENYNAEHKLANNEIRDVEVFSGKMMLRGKSYIYSIINDISIRKKNELEIQRLYTAIDQSLSPIALTDLNGIITYANPGYCYTSGYSNKELIGQSASIHKSEETPKQVYEDLWQTITKGEIWKGEMTNKKKNGGRYVEQVIISPVFDKNHKLLQFIKASRDITKELEIKKELIETKENAEESDRLKSAFLANMSHEIRTPMNGILGFTNLLQDSDFTGEEKDEFINIIKQRGDRLLNTVNDLIDISMIESGQINIEKAELNVSTQIESLYSFFKPEAEEKGLQLEFNTKSENKDLVIETDETKFASILTNLIKNAIKFSIEEIVQIEYECLEGRNKGHAKFSVKDQGIGIAHDKLNRIFNRFEQEDITATKGYDGSGIGLSITKAYVEALGGQIWVESEKSKGSNFQFTLPLNSKIQTKSIIDFESYNEEQPVKNGIKILIAEDEEEISKYLSIILKGISSEIILAKNGAKALEIFITQGDIDLILMDISMPVMDGYEATRRIQEIDSNIPIIAQTAFALSNDEDKMLASGFDNYISKPINRKN